MFEVGQKCEMKCFDEDRVFWSRVRIYSDDGKIVWVQYAVKPGNAFPVPRKDLRSLEQPEPTRLALAAQETPHGR